MEPNKLKRGRNNPWHQFFLGADQLEGSLEEKGFNLVGTKSTVR